MARSIKADNRWTKMDDNFRMQVNALLAKVNQNKEWLSAQIGVSHPTMCKRYKHPSTLTKREERMLMIIFESAGLHYDVTMGEGQ